MSDSSENTSFFSTIVNKKLNVLFWDDQAEDEYETLFTEIKMGFERYGWSTTILKNKEEVINTVLLGKYDAVVLDLLENRKPVGLEMLKEIRGKEPFLPIIIFTIAPEMRYVQSAMRGDVSYYLTKPIKSYHDVIRAVEVAFDREKAKKRLFQERYFATVGKLAAGVAHFIKNSLWNIGSRAQTLLDETDKKDDAYKLLETIKRRCDDANQVVINLLNFAKRGKNKDERIRLSIIDTVEDVLSLLERDLEYNDISIKKKFSDKEIIVKGNEFELKEVFLNIMKNAIEAMPEGGELKINISLDQDNVIMQFSDNGMGMDKETLENLFIPFYTTKKEAVGFGLFDSQRIIQQHDGTTIAESSEGEGSTFVVEIPALPKKKDE